MTEEFNKWWDNDLLTQNNPYVDGTPAFWAWEGWRAGVKAEREACAKVCSDLVPDMSRTANDASVWDVATFDCAAAIRNRGNT
jgi:hypothetical protein